MAAPPEVVQAKYSLGFSEQRRCCLITANDECGLRTSWCVDLVGAGTALLPWMLAEPIIWRRYHSPRVSPSIEVLTNQFADARR
jgi:hypothetical protein